MDLKERLDLISMEVELLTKELCAWQTLKDKLFDNMMKTQDEESVNEYLNVAKKLDECRSNLAFSQKRYEEFMAQNDQQNIISKYPVDVLRLAFLKDIPDELSSLAEVVKADVKEVVGFKPVASGKKSAQTEPGE